MPDMSRFGGHSNFNPCPVPGVMAEMWPCACEGCAASIGHFSSKWCPWCGNDVCNSCMTHRDEMCMDCYAARLDLARQARNERRVKRSMSSLGAATFDLGATLMQMQAAVAKHHQN